MWKPKRSCIRPIWHTVYFFSENSPGNLSAPAMTAEALRLYRVESESVQTGRGFALSSSKYHLIAVT